MKRAVPALLLVGLLVTGGCLGFLTGEEAVKFESNEVSVSEDAQSATGYEQARKEANTITRNFSAAGETRQVKVTNHLAEYKRQVNIPALGEQELARFTVLSTPKVEVLDRTFNPVGDMSNREIAEMVQQEYQSVSDIQKTGERNVTVLGEQRKVTEFEARAQTVGGQQVDVYLHITKFGHGDDYIVSVAVYPQQLNEQENVDRLLKGVEHATGEGG